MCVGMSHHFKIVGHITAREDGKFSSEDEMPVEEEALWNEV